MALFVVYALDNPAALEARLATRPAHVEHLKSHEAKLRVAGPMLDAEGKACGSLLIIEADDAAAAKAIVDTDPYAAAGVFKSVDVHAFTKSLGSWS